MSNYQDVLTSNDSFELTSNKSREHINLKPQIILLKKESEMTPALVKEKEFFNS
jgi:hypothetical protein